MSKYIIITAAILLSSCATMSTQDKKRDEVLKCIKDLKINDSDTMDAFEVCRQIYHMKKV